MSTIVSLDLAGGYSTEFGPSAPHVMNGDRVAVPWLSTAENIIYLLDGWFQKMPGASKVNSTATGASDAVMGIFDYWKSGTVGDPAQQRVLYSGTQIYTESSGTLTSRKTGLESGKMPWFEVMNDVLVIATDSSVDVPMTWDQTTFADLGGSPPNFAFMVEHKDRMWAAGVFANKSRLYYTVLGNYGDWAGAGSGSIDVAEDDGDVITAIRSHRDELLIFKGPYKGSIYRITGSAPTGSDAFVLHEFINGTGATNMQAIVPWADDLIFWDHFGIHSLKATAAFGDYNVTNFISFPINDLFTRWLNHSRFKFVWGLNFASAGCCLWTVSRAGASTNDLIILWDYRFTPPRFALWPAYTAASLALVLDSSQETVPWSGTYTGFVLRGNRAARNVGGTAYTGKVTLPYLSFSDPFYDKQAVYGRVGYAPKGDTTFTVGYQRDGFTQQTESISQVGSAMLGDSTDNFVLDTDTLGGGRFLNAFFPMKGDFKEIQLEFSQGSNDVDFEVHSFAMEIQPLGISRTAVAG